MMIVLLITCDDLFPHYLGALDALETALSLQSSYKYIYRMAVMVVAVVPL